MSYDKSKIPPTPWKPEIFLAHNSETGEQRGAMRIVDADGKPIKADWYPEFVDDSDTEQYIMHCVNLHDELVKALAKHIELIDSGDCGCWEPTQERNLLKRARNEDES